MGSRPGHGNWDERYADGASPPWEIGAAQPALAARLDRIPIASPVLDAGCGTGDLAILVAGRGHRVLGLDCSARAIAAARAKSSGRDLDVEFRVGDAEHLERLDIRPRTVFDSGLLHNLDEPGRRAYVAGLTTICDAGAVIYVLAIASEAGPGWDLTRAGLGQLFSASSWVEVKLEAAEVLAHVDGEALRLPSFLMSATRAP